MEGEITPREVLLNAFPGLNPAQAEEIIASGQILTTPSNTILCHEGAQEDTFYILLSGQVEVTKQVRGQPDRVLQHLKSGGFFGEMAILHDAARAATVTTTEPVRVLQIHKEAFTGMIEGNNRVALAIIREVSRRLRNNDEMAIEDLRMKAKELADAYQQLAEEEFARSEFLTTVAHELRTPLMAANGYLQAIRMGMIQGDALPGGLETVWRNLQEITSLTNDILFLQEMDLILPEFRPTDLASIVRAVIEEEQPLAKRLSVTLHLQVDPNLKELPGDPRSLHRAIDAVLNNAIKFSPDGGEVDISIQDGEEAVCLTIQDHGVGIPPEAMPRIFQRFFHLDIICGRVFRGIGLGLSIAKHVIEQHHGTIEVESQLEKGSRFTIRLKKQPG